MRDRELGRVKRGGMSWTSASGPESGTGKQSRLFLGKAWGTVGIRCMGVEEFSSGVFRRRHCGLGKVNGVRYLEQRSERNGLCYQVGSTRNKFCSRRNHENGSGLWNDG
jgi:hypothetical protein